MPFARFDRSRLRIQPLANRTHDLEISTLLDPATHEPSFSDPALDPIARRMTTAGELRAQSRQNRPATILMMGAHVIRAGVSRHIIDWMQRGLISHVAMNGAGPIHDWEFARIGQTTESVARYIQSGEFGLWKETGEINDVLAAADPDLGFGEAVGKHIERNEKTFEHRDCSILAAGARFGIPVTIHVGIGYDIIHEHPNADGALLGHKSYEDFLIFAESVAGLEGGVLLNFGSAVMGPEVFLKALAMARNVADQDCQTITDFVTAVFDLVPLPAETHREATREEPLYYFRPWKTILARTVAAGGASFYVRGDHRETLPALHSATIAGK